MHAKVIALSVDTSDAHAMLLDKVDAKSVGRFRELYYFPQNAHGQDLIYLNGNSLGLLSEVSMAFSFDGLISWAADAVAGHWKSLLNWLEIHQPIRGILSQILGALPHEVVTMGSLTANLNHLLAAFYRPTLPGDPKRHKIIMMQHEFISDRLAVESQVRYHGHIPEDSIIRIAPDPLTGLINPQDIINAIREHGDELSGVLLGETNYLTGQHLPNIKEIATVAHQYGAWLGVDFAHAAGSTPLALHEWDVDWAVGCSYKHLNAGAGGIGLVFIHDRHLDDFQGSFEGWWGNVVNSRFSNPGSIERHRHSAEVVQESNPSIFATLPLFGALEIIRQAGWEAILGKLKSLGQYAHDMIRTRLPREIQIVTPDDPEQRGAQISMRILTDLESPAFLARLESLGFLDRLRQEANGIFFTHPDKYQHLRKHPLWEPLMRHTQKYLPKLLFASPEERDLRHAYWHEGDLAAPSDDAVELLLKELVEPKNHGDFREIVRSPAIWDMVAAHLHHSTLQALFDDPHAVASFKDKILSHFLEKKGLAGMVKLLEFEGILRVFGVVCDFRKPDIIRIAPVLYNSYQDVKRFTDILVSLLKD